MAHHNDRQGLVGVFSDRGQAEKAVEDLRRAGFREDQIGYTWRNENKGSTGTTDTDAGNIAGGAATGAISGGILGGLIGAATALLIPGVGPVLAGGILASALGGAAIGAAAGGLLGALMGLGIPEEEARYYETEFQSGNTLVTVKAEGRYQEARDILARNGAYDFETRDATKAPMGSSDQSSTYSGMNSSNTSGAQGYDNSGYTRNTSGYDNTTGATSGYSEMQGRGSTLGTGTGGTNIDDSSSYTGANSGRTTSDYSNTGRWEDVSTIYRSNWEKRYGTGSGRWEDYEPAYRYGWEQSYRPEYQGRSWSDVESNLRSDWETRHRDKPWDRFVDSVKDAWNDITSPKRTDVDTDYRTRNY
jgi:hypothetical protein